jgi:hypothetical protein
MDRRQEKRILYICLLGFAAILPVAINPRYGPYLSLIAIVFVIFYIRSDQKRTNEHRGFPVITNEQSDKTQVEEADKQAD